MTVAYLEFEGADGPVLVELGIQEVQSSPGVLKAGIAERLQDNLSKAQNTFDNALASLIRGTAGAFVRAANAMDDVPNQIEIEFGIKATGELSNLAIGKLSGEVNYGVKLTWAKQVDGPG